MDYLDHGPLHIVISEKKAGEFIKANLPGHKKFHVDGMVYVCLMAIRCTLEIDVTLDDINFTIRKFFSKNAHVY